MSRDELLLNIQLQPINIPLPPVVPPVIPPINFTLPPVQPLPQLNLDALIPPAPELLARTNLTLLNHVFNETTPKLKLELRRDVSQPGEKGFTMPGVEDRNDVDTATNSSSATTSNHR